MAVAAVVVNVEKGQKTITRTLLLTFSGSYSTGGETLDLTAVAVTGQNIEASQFHRNPIFGRINKGGCGGYLPELIKGAALTNWLIKFYESGADGGDLDEIAAAEYPAGITTADADFYVDLVENAA